MTFGETLFVAMQQERARAGTITRERWIEIANNAHDAEHHTSKRIPTIEEWLGYCALQFPAWPKADATKAWSHYESLGWKKGKTPIQKWRMCASTCHQNYLERNVTQQHAPRRKEAWELAIEQQKNNT
jgi:hypothetical protein